MHILALCILVCGLSFVLLLGFDLLESGKKKTLLEENIEWQGISFECFFVLE